MQPGSPILFAYIAFTAYGLALGILLGIGLGWLIWA